jgi:hypothetical protein
MLQLLVPTGLRYLVAVDVRNQMTHSKCWHANYVTPAAAATLITLCLVKAEREVTVVAFGTEGSMQPVQMDKNITMEQAQSKLKEVCIIIKKTDRITVTQINGKEASKTAVTQYIYSLIHSFIHSFLPFRLTNTLSKCII